MKTNLKGLDISRAHGGVTTTLLQLESFGMFCVLQYHMTPNYYKHKILLPMSYDEAINLKADGLFAAFDSYFRNKD